MTKRISLLRYKQSKSQGLENLFEILRAAYYSVKELKFIEQKFLLATHPRI